MRRRSGFGAGAFSRFNIAPERLRRARHLLGQRDKQALRCGASSLRRRSRRARGQCGRAYIGANGAGKSTLLKIIAGALPPDSGELTLSGKPLTMKSITDAARAGIAIVSQELSLFPALSVEENLSLAPGESAWKSRRSFARRAREVLAKLGVNVALSAPLRLLSLADRQLIEISRALLQNPRILILDEPTSSLHAAEVDRLHDVIRGLRNSGIGIIYVSHFLEELLDISNSLVILRNGKRVPEQSLRLLIGSMMLSRQCWVKFPNQSRSDRKTLATRIMA